MRIHFPLVHPCDDTHVTFEYWSLEVLSPSDSCLDALGRPQDNNHRVPSLKASTIRSTYLVYIGWLTFAPPPPYRALRVYRRHFSSLGLECTLLAEIYVHRCVYFLIT